ncbi:Tctex-1 [Tricharina praecox]|uniref:Tctex-1 n=1 Tax=Tricharina praecox TaxID=43433 RepID=UPI00221F785D|nr:Tctex-1 [Tricharina praecox]KAI5844119.1 Tctex-1 [Tricharina praecox]
MSDTKAFAAAAANSPIPPNRLKQIATDACTLALEKAEAYEHTRTEAWNTQIINHILRALISESQPAATSSSSSTSPPPSPWKFAVNSMIIQHLSPKATAAATTGEGAELINGRSAAAGGQGRRGMHSAQGAYWNNETDGMWSFKFDSKAMDVVISVIWVAV